MRARRKTHDQALTLLAVAVTLESAGQYRPEELIPQTAEVLLYKIRNVRNCLRTAVG